MRRPRIGYRVQWDWRAWWARLADLSRSRWGRRLLLASAGGAALVCGVVYGSWTRACAGGACPSIAVLDSYRPNQALKVYAADGRLMQELGVEHRTVLAADAIAPAMRAAFIAIEDKRFYEHGGIDFRRILGAMRANLLALGYAQGFSTITMQLARNVWRDKLPSTKSVRRKIREMRVALELEKTYSKDRILELYLNQIFLGGSAYGVDAGAQRYFGKSARDLNPAEAALLAAIANVPGQYDPRRYPGRALRRRNLVLTLMAEQGYLTPAEAERWRSYPIQVSAREDFGDVAPYFVEWVRQQLYARFGNAIYERGYRVYTTLDLDMQLAGEHALEEQLERIEAGEFGGYHHLTYQAYLDQVLTPGVKHTLTPYLQGGLIALEASTGYVRAMVGGRDFSDSEFNRATQAERQAGSTFKPFVFTAAIRAGKPASHMIDDAPVTYQAPTDTAPWEPQNFDDRFYGPMTMRRGLALSRNLVAVRLGLELGVQAVVGEAARFGISSPLPRYPSLFIGSASVIPLEMASAYTAFATLGVQAAPVGILRVEDGNGNIVWEPQVRRTQVMDPEHMWLVTNMLQGVVDGGTATGAVRGRGFPYPAGGKTGTTNDGTDVWFVGFTAELVTAVWMGLDQPVKIKANAQGGILAAPAWTQFMREVYERRPPPPDWRRPGGLVLQKIDGTTGYLATDFCPRQSVYFEWFIPGTEPAEVCPYHSPINRILGQRGPGGTR